MRRWHYRYAGLRIESEWPIPEWAVFARDEPPGPADVHIRQAREAENPAEPQPPPADFRFSIPAVGDFSIRHGREIVVSPVPAADEDEVRLFLLGSAWGALCYQRGMLAMHASVVRTGSGAVAFCGAPGAGKSTLAAWLTARGYDLVSDDLCCFDIGGAEALAFPSAPRLKLWSEALAALGWSREGLARDQSRTDKFILSLPRDERPGRTEPVPLRAICVLTWGDPALTRLRGMTALQRLVGAATYRPSYIESLGKTGPYWEQCFKLARMTPVWTLSRPREWAAMAEILGQLACQWPASGTTSCSGRIDKPTNTRRQS